MPRKKRTHPSRQARGCAAKSKEIVTHSSFERSSLGIAAVYFAGMLFIFLSEIGVIP